MYTWKAVAMSILRAKKIDELQREMSIFKEGKCFYRKETWTLGERKR